MKFSIKSNNAVTSSSYLNLSSRFIEDKYAESKQLLSSLVVVAEVDIQVAFTLLHMLQCGGLCHLARVTPSLASDALVTFLMKKLGSVLCFAQ